MALQRAANEAAGAPESEGAAASERSRGADDTGAAPDNHRTSDHEPPATPAQPITLNAADGQPLAAHWHPARGEGPAIGVAVLAPATGVPQAFYTRFAHWLAAQGVHSLRFDFRGTAASRPLRLRGFEAGFAHWTQDLDAAFGHALAQADGLPVSLIGHSIGGFLGPVAPRAAQLHRLLLVGAQSAYWRDFRVRQRLPMALLWHGLMPLATGLVGYFPGRALRLGEDLPRGVAMQWAARPWRDPWHEAPVATGYARALPPVHLIAADDDPFATPAALARVAKHLSGIRPKLHTILTGHEGPARIGHFDVFRPPCAPQVWPRLLQLAFPAE